MFVLNTFYPQGYQRYSSNHRANIHPKLGHFRVTMRYTNLPYKFLYKMFNKLITAQTSRELAGSHIMVMQA